LKLQKNLLVPRNLLLDGVVLRVEVLRRDHCLLLLQRALVVCLVVVAWIELVLIAAIVMVA
jgi:hypothetical protein